MLIKIMKLPFLLFLNVWHLVSSIQTVIGVIIIAFTFTIILIMKNQYIFILTGPITFNRINLLWIVSIVLTLLCIIVVYRKFAMAPHMATWDMMMTNLKQLTITIEVTSDISWSGLIFIECKIKCHTVCIFNYLFNYINFFYLKN